MSLPEPSFIDRDPEVITAEIIGQYEQLTGKTLYPAQVERLLIEDHARSCMEDAIQSGDQDRQRIMFREVLGLLEKVRD